MIKIFNVIVRLLKSARRRKEGRINRRLAFKKRQLTRGLKNYASNNEIKFAKRRLKFSFKGLIKQFAIVLTGIIWGVLIYILFWSPYFKISTIVVEGANVIPFEEIEKIVRQQLLTKRWFLLPQRNILFFNTQALTPAINEKFIVTKVEVSRDLPDTLIINIEEKTSALVWVSRGQPYLMDLTGAIIAKIDGEETLAEVTLDDNLLFTSKIPNNLPSTDDEAVTPIIIQDKQKTIKNDDEQILKPASQITIALIKLPPIINMQFPLIYDGANKNVSIGDHPLNTEIISCLQSIHDELNNTAQVNPRYFVAHTNGQGVILTVTDDDWKIFFNCEDDLTKQLTALELSLGKYITNLTKLKYIDLRYPGRVYYK